MAKENDLGMSRAIFDMTKGNPEGKFEDAR